MQITFRYIVISLIGLLFATQIFSAESDWEKAKKEFIADAKSKDEEVRVNVTVKLADNIAPKVEWEAVLLLTNQISNEIDRSKKGKYEEAVSIRVIDACVDGLRRITEDKAVKKIIEAAKRQSDEWRARFYVIKALGRIDTPEVIKALMSLIKDKTITLQVASFRALGQLKTTEAMEPASELLIGKTNWQVKLAILDYFRIMESPEALKYLKLALKNRDKIEPRVLSDLLKLLEEITQKMPAEGADPLLSTKAVILGEYYGLPIESSNIVFLMDTSGSMEAPVVDIQTTPESKEKIVISGTDNKSTPGNNKLPVPMKLQKKKEDMDKKPVKTRLDAVKKELANAIYNLDEQANFSIIFYSSGVRPWKIRTIPANFDNKLSALDAIDRQAYQGSTTTYDALEYAYKIMVETSSKKPNSPLDEVDGADTFFLLTDGYPTEGKIVETKSIVEAIRKINEIRQVKINTIAIGSPGVGNPDQPSVGVNTEFLKELAEITGGNFVDKTK